MKGRLFILLAVCTIFFYGCAAPGTVKSKKKKDHKPYLSQTNLITNGDFSNGTNGWFLAQNNTGAASWSVQNGELCVNITSQGTDLYSLAVGQNTLKTEKKGIYTLTFEAHSDSPIRISSFSQQSFDPWYAYSGIHYFDITPVKNIYTYTFTMRQPDDQKPLLYFYFGKKGNATIYFDNITMYKTGTEGPLVIKTNFPASIKPELYRGMTLGVTLDAPIEGASGTEIREEYFQMIKDRGFDHIRIPVKWSAHALQSQPYTIETEFLNRVDWAVSNTLALAMRAVLDIHNFPEFESNPALYKDFFMNLWKQIAEHYKDYPSGLYFELYNEPSNNLNGVWNDYAAEAVNLIRLTNPNRKIVIDVTNFAHVQNIAGLTIPNDPNLIVSFHFYEPPEFCFQGMEWAGMGSVSGVTWAGTAQEMTDLRNLLDLAKNWSDNHGGVEMWNGEFCAHYNANLADRARWTDFAARECEARGIGWAYWDFHEETCGIYDPDARTFRQEILNSLVPGM